MAEKKVSVRLVAEGGRRVRAELEGVGEAGARRLLGDVGEIGAEEDGADRRHEGRIGPVVPIPGAVVFLGVGPAVHHLCGHGAQSDTPGACTGSTSVVDTRGVLS